MRQEFRGCGMAALIGAAALAAGAAPPQARASVFLMTLDGYLSAADAITPGPALSGDTPFTVRATFDDSSPNLVAPTHLPGFVAKADELRGKGVDEIVGTAVNDAFVMGAWGKSAEVGDKVTLLADGNGDFAKALDLTMDGSGFGMGTRGQRWSMLVKDGKVETLNVEAPGAFEVSSADYLLGQL